MSNNIKRAYLFSIDSFFNAKECHANSERIKGSAKYKGDVGGGKEGKIRETA